MSRIEDMIREMCPDGVKRMTLGECCDFKRGSTITAKDAIEGDVPVIAGGQKPAYYHNVANRAGESITIAGSGAYAGFVSYWTIPIYVSDAFTIAPKEGTCTTKYLYYFLKNNQEKIHNTKKGSGVPHVHPSSIDYFEIPLPPLPIQEKIVEILEKFSLLSAELEAELEGRRKQYDFYRNRLLSFDSESLSELNEGRRQDESSASIVAPSILHQRSINEEFSQSHDSAPAGAPYRSHKPSGSFISKVEWKKLGEMVKIKNGKDYKHLASGNVPVYGTGGVMTYVDQFVYDKPTVLLPRKGSIEKVYFVNTPFWNVDTVYYTEIDETKVLPKYLYYCFTNINLASYNTATGAIPSLTQAVLNNIQFPIPPLAEQERIVRILDKFEALVTDLSAGLPAEIERVQKQYEYYRNKLLTFPEA